MSTLSKRIGARLKKLREGPPKRTQAEIVEELARRRCEVTQATISAIENGSRLPSLEVFAALLGIYNISADYALGLSDLHMAPGDIERDFHGGAMQGRLGSLLPLMSEENRRRIVAMAELLAATDFDKTVKEIVSIVHDLTNGDTASRVVDELNSRYPGFPWGPLGGDWDGDGLPPQNPH